MGGLHEGPVTREDLEDPAGGYTREFKEYEREETLQDARLTCEKLEIWFRDKGYSHEGLGMNPNMPIGIFWEARKLFRERHPGLDVELLDDRAMPMIRIIQTR